MLMFVKVIACVALRLCRERDRYALHTDKRSLIIRTNPRRVRHRQKRLALLLRIPPRRAVKQ